MYKILTKIFEEILQNFYDSGITVHIEDKESNAYCRDKSIVLSRQLIDTFAKQKLPRFSVMYHELGHALYTGPMSELINKWENIPSKSHSGLEYNNKYFHLINWIEDFYIEDRLLKDYPYLNDILKCLRLLPVTYDINAIDKAFNYYYVYKHSSSALSAIESMEFYNYIHTLLQYRNAYNFGKGPISLLISNSNETRYIKTLIEFYNWCVQKNIFKEDAVLPKLSLPCNIVAPSLISIPRDHTIEDLDKIINAWADEGDNSGGYSDHTHIVAKYLECFPDLDASKLDVFLDDYVAEEKLIKNEIVNQNRIDSKEQSLDGLFNSKYIDTSIQQSKVIIKNFFNPNRLVDQVLFKTPSKSFNNVSIYRDISGSTSGRIHTLINTICKFLLEHIPIAANYYLYASGDISILQTNFIDWPDSSDKPKEYLANPLFKQMSCGTNSDAIADVITEQLNDKWLNIIVTDGDLDSLMQRDNIESLLENVFVISLDDIDNIKNYIIIKNETEIPNIIPALLKLGGM